jgi:hypothetical protein
MQPVKEKPARETSLCDDEADEDVNESGYNELLFFDFECIQENGTQEPNLCVIQNEAGDEWMFQGDKTRNEFCEWLFTKEHEGCIVVAHNFQGGVRTKDRFFSPGTDFAARANYILLRSYRINSNAVIFQFLLF